MAAPPTITVFSFIVCAFRFPPIANDKAAIVNAAIFVLVFILFDLKINILRYNRMYDSDLILDLFLKMKTYKYLIYN